MRFPDPRNSPHDIIALGGDLSPETLRAAYGKGIFPWPVEEYPLCWFSPRRRAILFFDEIHRSRSVRRAAARSRFSFTIDRAFEDVITACAEMPRPGQEGTWILPEIRDAYVELHRIGMAHSVEAWDGGELVGGVYGVDAGGAFSGESMFHRASDASKLALLFLVEHLRSRGAEWLDIQVMTPHMRSFGARPVSRARFLDLLEQARRSGRILFDPAE